MQSFFQVDPAVLLAIIGMGIATYLTRIAGLVLVRFVDLRGRTRAALEAVPVAVLMSVIAPTVLATGIAETSAAIVTMLAATRLPLLGVVVVGVVSAATFRAMLGAI
ncbi:AzlD family protein [Maritalea sp.]|uniref:AzlD family protein n=1 Tax=Maritalea sp. TaxID=2003361 RepID=UPI003EF467D1